VNDVSNQTKNVDNLQLYSQIVESSGEAIVITDAAEKIISVNRAFTQISQFTSADVLGETPRVMRSGRHDPQFFQEMWAALLKKGAWAGEIWNSRKDGSVYPAWVTVRAVKDKSGNISHYFSAFSDISERMSAEERIRQLALYDALTGLPNRTTFYSLIKQALGSASSDKDAGIMLID
jgi:PAS domain S-box-containing protein